MKFTRVKDWVHFLFLPLLTIVPGFIDWLDLILAIVCSGLCLGYAYGYNQYKDEGLDKQDESVALEMYGMKKNGLVLILLLMLILTLMLSFVISRVSFLAAIISLFGSTVYSGGPTLKNVPIVGTLANLLIFIPLAFLGGGEAINFNFFIFVIALVGLLMQSQMIHEAADYKDDIKNRIATTAVKYGLEVSKKGSLLWGVLSIVAFIVLALNLESKWVWGAVSVLAAFDLLYFFYSSFQNEVATASLRLKHRYIGFVAGTVAYLAYFFSY